MSLLRAISRTASFLRVLFVPVLIDDGCHLDQPQPVFDVFDDFSRAEELDAIGRRVAERLEQSRRDESRNVMRLTVEHPGRLFRREAGRKVPQ